MSTKKGMSIKWKLIVTILPIVLLAIVVIALTITNISRGVITTTTEEKMFATLGENINSIDGGMDEIKMQAETFANAVAG